MANKLRRIVTAENEAGRSFVLSDDEPPITMEIPNVVKMRDLWRTGSARDPVPVRRLVDLTEPTLEPPPGGTKFSIAEIPPAKDSADAASAEEIFGALDSQHVMVEGAHPTMHATETIDYAVVLSGELYLILDREEVLVRTGDFVVQGGVRHTWENRSDASALLLAVLVSAKRE